MKKSAFLAQKGGYLHHEGRFTLNRRFKGKKKTHGFWAWGVLDRLINKLISYTKPVQTSSNQFRRN